LWWNCGTGQICGGTVALDRFVVELWHWTDLSPSTSVSLRHTIPRSAPNSSSSTSGSHRKEKGAELGTFQKCSFGNGGTPKTLHYPPTDFILFIRSIQRPVCLVTAKCISVGSKYNFIFKLDLR